LNIGRGNLVDILNPLSMRTDIVGTLNWHRVSLCN
jgi:hypothetical protein